MADTAMLQGRLKVIKVSQETVKGTAVAGATLMQVYDPVINCEPGQFIDRPYGWTHGGPGKGEPGPELGTCSFRSDLRGNGTTGLDAATAILLQACGLKLATGVYNPCTPILDQKCATVDVYEDGCLKRLCGAMARPRIVGELGKPVAIEWNFRGIYSEQADAAMPTADFGAPWPMITRGITMTLAAVTPLWSRFELAQTLEPELREDASCPNGLGYYIIGAARQWTLGLDAEHVLAATWSPWSLFRAKTPVPLAMTLSDGTVDLAIAAPALQYLSPQEAMRGSKLVRQLNMQALPDDGDDEVTMTAS